MRKRIVALLLAAGVLVAAVAAYAQTVQPAIQTKTPKSEEHVTNIDVLRQQLKNYYGAPLAATGSGSAGTWKQPLNTDSNYADEARSVAKQGGNWLAARTKLPNKAIVLDVDDTTLATWNYELYSNWDFNPTTNGCFVDNQWFPAVPGMVDMVTKAADEGYKIFFLTGRPSTQEASTLGNLTSDAHVPSLPAPPTPCVVSGGLPDDVDAGYPAPSDASATEDGLFTKPVIGSYPAYLDKPEFCAAAIHATPAVSCPTIRYKSGVRAHLENDLGWNIVANFGDQFSDLEGGFADKTFKLPNPNYFLP
jgi:hypothetical protein